MSNLLSSWFNSPVQQHQNILSKFISHNNAPVNQFCQGVPINQPSFISTTFGQSIISLSILVIYFWLYRRETNRTGVEDRLLVSFIVGNLVFSILTFNDYFNLTYAIINCNDFKNGAINLYQVSESIEYHKLTNFIHIYALDIYENFFDYVNAFVNLIRHYISLVAGKLNDIFIGGYIDLIKKLVV